MKFNSPQLGFNNNVRHKGRVFHIQTEDSGAKHPHIITHLFADGGRILKSTKTSYAEFLEEAELAKKVKSLMQDQHKAMFIALRAGKFDHMLGDLPTEAAGHGKPPEEDKPAPTVRDGSIEAAARVAAGDAPAPAAQAASEVAAPDPSKFVGEAMRLPTIPSSLDLDAAAAQGLAIAAAQAKALAEASIPPAPSPPAPAVTVPQAPPSGPGAAAPPSSKPGASGSALSRFAEKQGPPPAHAAPFRNVFSGRTSSADLSAAAAQARGSVPPASSPSSQRTEDPNVARRPPTNTKLEPPRSRGPAQSVPPPARPPAEPPRARPPAGPGPLHPPGRPEPRPAMAASLDLDIATLERASEQAQAPVYQQVRDLPPPPAAFLKPALGNTSYRSVTPQAAQIVSSRPSQPGRSPTGPRQPEARPSPAPRAPDPRQADNAGRYAPSRPASIFGSARPQEGSSIFGEDLISEKSLDEVILSYLAEDLEGPAKK
jgi:hypothetical protein